MTSTERKRLFITAAIGTLFTGVIAIADHLGWLLPLEHLLYDKRARDCQFFTPPPTDKLVHLDIDDITLAGMGRWPWPRTTLAIIVNELHNANAKAVGLDILFPEAAPGDDPILAKSFNDANNVLVPISFDPKTPATPTGKAMVATMGQNLELTNEELNNELVKQGIDDPTFVLIDSHYVQAREAAMFNRLIQIDWQQDQTPEGLRAQLLPKLDPHITSAPELRVLQNQFDRVDSMLWLRRHFARPVSPDLPQLMPAEIAQTPVPTLARAAATTGFVYYLPDSDSKVRSIPFWAEHRGWMFPQLGLALACKQLDVSIRDIQFHRNRMIIPVRGKDIVVPMRNAYVPAADTDAAMFFDIPWFGSEDWKAMYDARNDTPGATTRPAPRMASMIGAETHIPIVNVWDIHLFKERIRTNNASADKILRFLINTQDSVKLREYNAQNFSLDDPDGRLPWMDWIHKKLADDQFFDMVLQSDLPALERAEAEALRKRDEAIKALKAEGLTDDEISRRIEKLQQEYTFAHDEAELMVSLKAMQNLPVQTRELRDKLRDAQAKLRRIVEGRSVLVGWTATAALADFVPTPMHSRCPGVVVHGAIFNSIMTGEFWWPAPNWVTPAIILALGILTTLAVSFLSPFAAAACSLVMGFAYLIVNGILLFDYGNTLVGIAGPLTAVALVWGATTIYRYIDEIRERRHITRRFRNYVDPALVKYVIDHPDEIELRGEQRDMTVVFTDLAGFTTISERLGPKTVEILNQYFGLMVPVISSNTGFVNKFLGDGIMFFYGAPIVNNDHAINAVTTTLQMHDVLPAFNLELESKGLPPVKMRAGISTGSMIVGDAGGSGRSDYTVLGDSVNLGARLESANKYTGTQTLITQNTLDLCRDRFLVRPVARLVVKGKTEGVMTYEPLAFKRDANEEQLKLVELTKAVVDAYTAGDFKACLHAIAAMETVTGPVKFTQLYATICNEYIANPPTEFSGLVVLEEK